MHEHLVEQPRDDLQHVQADEIWVKAQGMVLWLAMAMQVGTRLWLGAVVSERRDRSLITELMQHVRACALCRPLLFCVDGLSAYVKCNPAHISRTAADRPSGPPPLRPWDGIYIAQVIKQYQGRRVSGVIRRICQGQHPSSRP